MLTLCHNKRVTLIEFEANWPRIAHVKESEIVIAGIFFFFFWGSTVSENKAFFFLSAAAMVTDMGNIFCLSLQTAA